MKKFFYGTLALAFVLGAGTSFAYDEGAVANGGKIQGHVSFKGAMPKLPEMVVQKNNDFCGNSKANEALVVGKDGGVKFAIGYLDKIGRGKPVDRNSIQKMAESKCVFTPHVYAVFKGQKIEINNEDPILHNINVSVDGIQRFNKGQPKQNQVLQAQLRQPGVAEITCDSHTHMHSWALIIDHPYFAVSDDSGKFEISDIPPGKYTLKVWHEAWTTKGKDDDGRFIWDAPKVLSQDVEVKAGETTQAKFELK